MQIPIDLRATLRTYEKTLASHLEDTAGEGLGYKQIAVLLELYKQDGQHPSALAVAIGEAVTSFTLVIDKLQRMGFIKRSADKDDRRAIFIHLTGDGRAIENVVKFAVAQTEREFGGGVK